MICPICSSDTKVTETRLKYSFAVAADQYVRRTRKCLVCNHVFRTIEITEDDYKSVRAKVRDELVTTLNGME